VRRDTPAEADRGSTRPGGFANGTDVLALCGFAVLVPHAEPSTQVVATWFKRATRSPRHPHRATRRSRRRLECEDSGRSTTTKSPSATAPDVPVAWCPRGFRARHAAGWTTALLDATSRSARSSWRRSSRAVSRRTGSGAGRVLGRHCDGALCAAARGQSDRAVRPPVAAPGEDQRSWREGGSRAWWPKQRQTSGRPTGAERGGSCGLTQTKRQRLNHPDPAGRPVGVAVNLLGQRQRDCHLVAEAGDLEQPQDPGAER
jgi:hypothetical protein